ncbi:MAG: hypothetical protein AAF743_16815, partial [Planctomycetota bacterium]
IYRATFDTPLRTSVSSGFFGTIVLSSDDVTLVDSITGNSVTGSISYSNPPDEDPFIDWRVNDLNEGVYELRLLANPLPDPGGSLGQTQRFQSEAGISLDGNPSFDLPSGDGVVGDDFVVNFLVDRDGVTPMPAFEGIDPFQSGVYTSQIGGTITDAADVDTFSLSVTDNAPVALTMTHVGGAGQFRVVVRNPDGSVAADVTAAGAGGDVLLPTLNYPEGDIEIEVTSVDGGTGAFLIEAAYGATTAAAGDDAATAVDVAPTFIGYDNGSGRYAALGSVTPAIEESVAVLTGGFAEDEARVLTLLAKPLTFSNDDPLGPLGFDPVGDVTLEIQADSFAFFDYSLEGLQTGFIRGTGTQSQRTITVPRDVYRELAADGKIYLSLAESDGDALSGDVSVTTRVPHAERDESASFDADLYRIPAVAGEEISLFLESLSNDKVFVQFEDANGNVLAADQQASEQTSFRDQRIAQYVPSFTGEVFARVVGEGEYVLTVGKNATVVGDPFNPPALIGPSGRAIDDLRPNAAFTQFRFFAAAGDEVTVTTDTP